MRCCETSPLGVNGVMHKGSLEPAYPRVGIDMVMTRSGLCILNALAIVTVTVTRSAETSALFIAERLSSKWIFSYIAVITIENT